MTRRPPQRKIDWTALTFALALFISIITAAKYLGGADAQIQSLDRRVDALEQQLRDLRKGVGVDEGAPGAR